MELPIEDKAILAHVVVDPDVWVAHALEHGGETVVTAKIDRWRDTYLAAATLSNYMTRAQRDAYKSPEQIAVEIAAKEAQVAHQELESLIQSKIREQAVTALIKEGKLDKNGKVIKEV